MFIPGDPFSSSNTDNVFLIRRQARVAQHTSSPLKTQGRVADPLVYLEQSECRLVSLPAQLHLDPVPPKREEL